MIRSNPLSHLVAGYLHQDWPLDYETVWDAVDAFCREETPAVVNETRKQILELLLRAPTEKDLQRILIEDLMCGYWPTGDGLTFRSWLEKLASTLARHT